MATELPAITVDALQDAPLNIAPVVEEDTPLAVGLAAEDAPAPIDSQVAESRSFKFKYGLDAVLKKSKEEIFNSLNRGEEGSLRAQAADEIDQRKQAATQKVIQHIIGAKGGPLSPAESLGITTLIANMNTKTDPEMVLEESYGKQFMFTMDEQIAKNPDSPAAKLRREFPEYVAQVQEQQSSYATKREYLNTVAENVEAEVKAQEWVPYVADTVKTMMPGYTDVKKRGNVEGTGIFDKLALGQNIEAQGVKLFNMPTPEFKKEVDRIAAGLRRDNPQLAAEFLRSLQGMSMKDSFLQSTLAASDYVGVGIGTGAAKAFRGSTKVIKSLAKDTEKAAIDIAKAAGDPNVSKSTIEAASGDLASSAVTRVVTDAMAEKMGVSRATAQAVEALPEALRADEALVKANPGRFGQDIVNRIIESSETIKTSLIKAVKNVTKVERLPEIMANEVSVKLIQESIKNTYRDIRNAVLDVSKPYKESVANTYLIDMRLGKNDGTYFETRELAENFAEHHGLKSGRIAEATDATFTKDTVSRNKILKNIKAAEDGIAANQRRFDNPNTSPAARAKAAEQLAEDGLPESLAKFKGQLATLDQKVTVEQQGFGYYIKITKPINETDNVIRDLIAETSNTKIPNSPLQQFLNGSVVGKLRTPEETLSLAERQNRLVTTYTPSIYFEIMKNNAPTLNSLLSKRFGKGRNKRKDFERVLEAGQHMKDPNAIDDVSGYFFKSPAELEEHYLRITNRLPDQDEIVAYFEFKRGMEIDRIFRNIAEHRNQQRVGAETHKLTALDEAGKIVSSPEFSGVTRNKLSAADDNILIMGEKLGDERIRNLQGMSVAERKEFQKEMDAGGRKLVELYAPEHKPLNGFGEIGDTRVRYVLTKTSEVRELDWNQIPRRGGGHMEHDYDYYLKQARVSHDKVGNRYWYEGDTTIMPIQVRAMGAKVAEHLNEVRKLLVDKKIDEAREYSNKNLHVSWDMVHNWFIGKPDANGKFVPARLSLHEPIHVLRKNESVVGVDKDLERRYTNFKGKPSTFKNGQKEGSLSRQSQVEFAAQRDAFDLITFEDVGTRKNPLYQVAQAKLVDPITTMNRGLARIAKSNFLDDYKTMSVEHWLKQASKYLEATDSEIRHAPFYYFNEAKFKKDAPAEIKSALETSRYHTMQLTGTPSTTDAVLHSWAQKAYDSLYENFGPKGLVIDPAWMVPKLKDPFRFIRSMVFHPKMGIFNPVQFLVQANNYANIYGIAGSKMATPGTFGAQLHFWSTANSNPAIIKHLDELAVKFGSTPGSAKWRPGEFQEAFEALQKTGFGNTGSEHAVLDNPMSEKVVMGKVNKFFDAGLFFFRNGERNAKYGAWYTAYKEFREVNPTGRLTDSDLASILQRADLLNINMSRASSSALHQGIMSVPTQFYTYQIRLMELMTSNRISTAAKARLFATNGLLYGIPMATGLSGLPLTNYIREKAMDGSYGQRYQPGENYFSTLFMEGLPAMLGAVLTGGGDIQKGSVYDVGSRFGTKGLEFLGGLDRKDKSLMDMIGGPAWSMIKGTVEQSDGFWAAMGSMINGDSERFPVVVEDIIDLGKEATTVATISRTYAAIQTGRWMSKKESYLSDTSTANAIFAAVTGLKDQAITDIQTMTNAVKNIADDEKKVEKQFTQEFRRALLLMDTDPEQAHKYMTRARAWLEFADFPQHRISQLLNKAIRDNESLVNKTRFDFYVKRAPESTKDSGIEAMKRLEELKQKRGEK